MVERLSTLQTFTLGLNTILERQADLQRTQQQLATGKRILSPADDPATAVQVLDIEEDLALVDQYARNASLASGQLAQEESALEAIGLSIQRVQELAIQGNNATLSPEDRQAIAVELDQRLDELVALGNKRDGNDEYLFAGFQARSAPFSRSGNTVTYSGDDGQRFLDIAPGSQVAVRDSGQRVFLSAAAGNGAFDFSAERADGSRNLGSAVVRSTRAEPGFIRDTYTIRFTEVAPGEIEYTVLDGSSTAVAGAEDIPYSAGDAISFNGATVTIDGVPADGDQVVIDSTPRQSIFVTVAELIEAFEADDGSNAADSNVANAVASALANLDHAQNNVLEVRTDVGSRLNRIEGQQAINEDFELALRKTLSEAQDLDFAEAITRLNLQLVALQAAQQTFVSTQGLTLFDYF